MLSVNVFIIYFIFLFPITLYVFLNLKYNHLTFKSFMIFIVAILLMQVAKVLQIWELFIIGDFFIGTGAILLLIREILRVKKIESSYFLYGGLSLVLLVFFIISLHTKCIYVISFYIFLLAFSGFLIDFIFFRKDLLYITMYGCYSMYNIWRTFWYKYVSNDLAWYVYVFVVIAISLHLISLFNWRDKNES